MHISEEICLLHDTEKFLLVDLAVAIPVCLINHFLKLLVCHPFTKLLGHALQDLVLGVTIKNLMSHHLEKLLVLDGPASIIIDIRDHLLDLLLLWLKAEGAHGYLQLL